MEWNASVKILPKDLSVFPMIVIGFKVEDITRAIEDLENVLDKEIKNKVWSENIVKEFTDQQVSTFTLYVT